MFVKQSDASRLRQVNVRRYRTLSPPEKSIFSPLSTKRNSLVLGVYYLNLSRPSFRSDLRAFTQSASTFCRYTFHGVVDFQRDGRKLAAVRELDACRTIFARISPTRISLTFPKRHVKNVRYSARRICCNNSELRDRRNVRCERQTVARRGREHCRQPREAKFGFTLHDRWATSAIAIMKYACSFLSRM